MNYWTVRLWPGYSWAHPSDHKLQEEEKIKDGLFFKNNFVILALSLLLLTFPFKKEESLLSPLCR